MSAAPRASNRGSSVTTGGRSTPVRVTVEKIGRRVRPPYGGAPRWRCLVPVPVWQRDTMQPTATAVRRSRFVDRWRRSTFGAGSDDAHRRRLSDCVRVGIAAALLIVAARHAGTTTETERALFDVFNSLPNGLLPLFRSIYRLGALWAVGLVVVSALVGRRWHLARDLLIAGVLAWAFGRIMGE